MLSLRIILFFKSSNILLLTTISYLFSLLNTFLSLCLVFLTLDFLPVFPSFSMQPGPHDSSFIPFCHCLKSQTHLSFHCRTLNLAAECTAGNQSYKCTNWCYNEPSFLVQHFFYRPELQFQAFYILLRISTPSSLLSLSANDFLLLHLQT